jgi:hypothetical protein
MMIITGPAGVRSRRLDFKCTGQKRNCDVRPQNRRAQCLEGRKPTIVDKHKPYVHMRDETTGFGRR